MTSLKFIYQDQIHKVSQLPSSFASLEASLKAALNTKLPQSYFLQYQDLEGDRVMLTNEEDFKAMVLTELPKDAVKSLKVYVIPKAESSPNTERNQKLENDTSRNVTVGQTNSFFDESISRSRVQDSQAN